MKVFLDIETGGFSKTRHGICEIAMAALSHTGEIVATYETLIRPYMQESGLPCEYTPEAMKTNGLTAEQLQSGKTVREATADMVKFFEQYHIKCICGHNSVKFDTPRLDHILSRFQNRTISHLLQIDTMDLVKERYNLDSYSLENLCENFGIINPMPHRAMGDVLATIALYKKINER